MRTPASLQGLADYGLIDEVLRPLMSGKEAQIYLVLSQGEQRVAKVYREAEHRNFKHRSQYTEGRTSRNSRDRRAVAKRSRYGRQQDEAAWRAAEVDMIYRLSEAGVRVPTPYHFVDSVLLMELVQNADGEPAPRLGDLTLGADEAAGVYERLLQEVIRMLCAGVVHGDLSDFNVLMDAAGPVLIDFPQSVDAGANAGARKLLLRDVENLHTFARRSIPGVRPKPYAQEMWELYQRGELTPDTRLRGQFKASTTKVDAHDVVGLVRDAAQDEQRRRQRQGDAAGPRRRRQEVIIDPPSRGTGGRGAPAPGPSDGQPSATARRRARKRRGQATRVHGGSSQGAQPTAHPQAAAAGAGKDAPADKRPAQLTEDAEAPRRKRRRRRRRKRGGAQQTSGQQGQPTGDEPQAQPTDALRRKNSV